MSILRDLKKIYEVNFDKKTDKYSVEKKRLILTALWLKSIIDCQKRVKIFVCGEKSWIEESLVTLGIINEKDLVYSNFDLRYPFPLNSEIFDIIVCTEVIEHLKDQNESDMTYQTYSGLYNLIKESNRILKIDGKFLVTTPNSVCIKNIARILYQKSPLMWIGHVREYSPEELISILKYCSFELVKIKTIDVRDPEEINKDFFYEYDFQWRKTREQLRNFFNYGSFSKQFRGENIFGIWKKNTNLESVNVHNTFFIDLFRKNLHLIKKNKLPFELAPIFQPELLMGDYNIEEFSISPSYELTFCYEHGIKGWGGVGWVNKGASNNEVLIEDGATRIEFWAKGSNGEEIIEAGIPNKMTNGCGDLLEKFILSKYWRKYSFVIPDMFRQYASVTMPFIVICKGQNRIHFQVKSVRYL